MRHPNSSANDPFLTRLRHFVFGQPRDLNDVAVFHSVSLVPFLAWVGLGADGLSSSAYGPEEAFKAFGSHRYLSLLLIGFVVLTVFLISASYKRIIEDFPHGGGGYVVTSKLLGKYAGVISGCALLVDYILTITVSIAAAGDALFSLVPLDWHAYKFPVELFLILSLTTLNIRGVKESILVLAPIFLLFLATHFVLIMWGIIAHIPEVPATVASLKTEFQADIKTFGWLYLISTFLHAYSLGGGTYTGIEAVSNGVSMMREPKVRTAKRTMAYMASSLAFTAAGLILCYLLWRVAPEEGKTLNAVLFEKILSTTGGAFGGPLVVVTLLAEGLLLIVAAQAGFMDGPRVLANMAVDSWVPRSFASLSERLTTSNGIFLMGFLAVVALVLSNGSVSQLVVMYSINVFLTFSLSIFGMLRHYWKTRKSRPDRMKNIAIFGASFFLCAMILVLTTVEKFREGGWLTLLATSGLVVLCITIKHHYLSVAKRLSHLYSRLEKIPDDIQPNSENLNSKKKTAVVLVGGFGGLGIYTLQSILRVFPGVFENVIFVSIGIVDSGKFKGEEELEKIKKDTEMTLTRYVDIARRLGVAAGFRADVGTDVVAEASALCDELAKEFPLSTFFTGKIIFTNEAWYQRLLHNETAVALQKRLQILGHTMVIMPTRV